MFSGILLTSFLSDSKKACREALVRCYGQKRGAATQTAESIMISQYGRALREADVPWLFPFFPKRARHLG